MKILPDIIAVIGAVLICYGVSMIFIPAAVILAGLFICLISFSLFKAGK